MHRSNGIADPPRSSTERNPVADRRTAGMLTWTGWNFPHSFRTSRLFSHAGNPFTYAALRVWFPAGILSS